MGLIVELDERREVNSAGPDVLSNGFGIALTGDGSTAEGGADASRKSSLAIWGG